MDVLCVLLLAISPILQNYKGPIANAGITVLIALFPYMVLKLLTRLHTFRFPRESVPLIVYYLYRLFAHGTSFVEFASVAIMIVAFIAIPNGYINVRIFAQIALAIAALASLFLILQYFCFYILHFHLQLVPTSLLHLDSEQWIAGVRTGLVGITGKYHGFYRPAAFFLEPSHAFLYLTPVLCMLLLAPDMKPWRQRMAVLVTVGLFLSTSGMGIGVGTGVWMLYGSLYRGKANASRIANIFTPTNIILVLVIFISVVVLYFNVAFFRHSIDRVFGINTGGSDAISGRFSGAYELAQTLSGSEFWFGISDSMIDVEFTLPGFFLTLFKYGMIGTVLSYVFYVQSLFKLEAQYFWLCFTVVLVSFFTAHTHATFYLLYFVVFLMDGYHVVRRRKHIGRQFVASQHASQPLPQQAAVARS